MTLKAGDKVYRVESSCVRRRVAEGGREVARADQWLASDDKPIARQRRRNV